MIMIALAAEMDAWERMKWRYQSLYRRRKRLMRVIMDVIGAGLKQATAGRAADLVIYFGVPWARIRELLDLQKQLRLSTFDARADKVFEQGLRRVGKQYGIAWQTGDGGQPYWKLGKN